MNRAEYLKQYDARRKQIVSLYLDRNKKLSFKKIGTKLDPPVSQQAVGIIYSKIKRAVAELRGKGFSYAEVGKWTEPTLTAAQAKQIHTEKKVKEGSVWTKEQSE